MKRVKWFLNSRERNTWNKENANVRGWIKYEISSSE